MRDSISVSKRASTGSAREAPSDPGEDYGQGWTQLTEHGKIYLSKKEKNVFICEGTKAAGFSASAYCGTPAQRSLVEGGAYCLAVELKCVPGEQCVDQTVYVLLDCHSMSDLSAGCDFCGVRLSFDSREIKVESHRKNGRPQTLFAQPGCTLLRTSAYLTLTLSLWDDVLSVSLNGVSLIGSLPTGRGGPPPSGSLRNVGIAVYGKTRCYLRRFRLSAAAAAAPHDAGGASERELLSAPERRHHAGVSRPACGRGGAAGAQHGL